MYRGKMFPTTLLLHVDVLSVRGQQNIDIGTVDGFQGREKDVIVLSCVRARSIAGSIGQVL